MWEAFMVEDDNEDDSADSDTVVAQKDVRDQRQLNGREGDDPFVDESIQSQWVMQFIRQLGAVDGWRTQWAQKENGAGLGLGLGKDADREKSVA